MIGVPCVHSNYSCLHEMGLHICASSDFVADIEVSRCLVFQVPSQSTNMSSGSACLSCEVHVVRVCNKPCARR